LTFARLFSLVSRYRGAAATLAAGGTRRAREAKMSARLGHAIYRLANVSAALILVWVVGAYLVDTEEGYPALQVMPLILAAVIWLIGLACRLESR
jgi:hypothetical protein